MAKVILGSAWATPDFLFDLSPKQFEAIEEAGKITLNDHHRSELLDAMRCHIRHRPIVGNAPAAEDVKTRLERARDAAAALNDSISNLYDRSEASNVALSEVQTAIGSKCSLPQLVSDSSALADACDRAIHAIAMISQGGRGRRPAPDFEPFIKDIAVLFQSAGGHLSAAYSPESKFPGRRGTPFVRFAWTNYRFLPEDMASFDNESTFGEAVNRIVKKLQKL